MSFDKYIDNPWRLYEGCDIPSSVKTTKLLRGVAATASKILDIGCGYGKTCFDLLDKHVDNITGIDINEKGIESAEGLLRAAPAELRSRCSFQHQDATQLSFDDGSFDLAIMQAFLTTLTRVEDRARALSEAKRVIRTGGYLYLAVFMQTWHSPIYRERYERGVVETGQTGSFQALDAKTQKVAYQAHHYDEKELVYLLLDAGFSISSFEYTKFKSRTGNSLNGALVLASAD